MKFTRVRINDFYNLKDVDLDLTEGNALIVGPNGSGKSNIIKCIDFLVQWILGRRSTSAKIWDVNSPQSFIEVNAVFCKAEVEFFSNLRLWYLLCGVCDIIVFIITILKNLLVSHDLLTRFGKGNLSFWVDQFHKENIFCDLPKERLRALFENHNVGRTRDDGNFSFNTQTRSNVDWRDPCVGPLIQETLHKLFPKLLKITQKAMQSERSRPKEGSDVFMWVRTADPGTPNDLSISHKIVDDIWLPATAEEENTAIWSSLEEIFGDLKGIDVTLEGLHGRNASTNPSLQNLISNLVNLKRFDSPQLRCSGTDSQNDRTWYVETGQSSYSSDFAEKMKELPAIMRWLSCCLRGHSEVDKILSTDKQSFVEEMAKKFLESSLCILPQSRGLFGQESRVSLDLNKVEQMLIQFSLSSDEQEQKQYKSAVDALKSVCGLDIHVRQKHFYQTREENAQAIKRLGDDLLNSHITSPLEVGKCLSELAEQVMQLQPSSIRLEVLATHAVQYGDSPYSITTQLIDLSGGEIELLMVLCAVHLSGADTVLLDEPGHSLHPPMQAQLRRWLETQRPTDQVCVAISHSTEFISPQTMKCLYHMSLVGQGFKPFRLVIQGHGARSTRTKDVAESSKSKVSGSSHGVSAVSSQARPEDAAVVPQSSETTTVEVTFSQDVVPMLMRPNMTRLFFATGLYFVEGETDQRVLTAMRHCMMTEASTVNKAITMTKEGDNLEKLKQARKVKKVREMDRWDILALNGCGEAVKAYKIAKELNIPCAVVLDVDAITVKQKKIIHPLNAANWKKSSLYSHLSKVAGFLPDVKNLLQDVEKVFGQTPSQILRKFAENGFWIWDGDLEEALLSNSDARQKLHEIIVRSTRRSNYPNVQDNKPSPSGIKRKEVDQPNSTQEHTTTSNKRVKTAHSGVTASTPPQQQAKAASEMGRTIEASRSDTTESQRSMEQVRRELHDQRGWREIPWDTLVDAVDICLKDEGNPFARLYEFMIRWQYTEKTKKEKRPDDLLSIVLPDDID